MVFLAGCPFSGSSPEANDREEKVGRLAVYMQQRYRRELQTDGFEINYVPAPPDKIMIMVKYKPTASRSMITTLLESAKEIIHRKGMEMYGLSQVDVETVLHEVD